MNLLTAKEKVDRPIWFSETNVSFFCAIPSLCIWDVSCFCEQTLDGDYEHKAL